MGLVVTLGLLVQIRVGIAGDDRGRELIVGSLHGLLEVVRHVVVLEFELTHEMDLLLHKLCFDEIARDHSLLQVLAQDVASAL